MEESLTCPVCSHQNPDDSLFCQCCGNRLEDARAAVDSGTPMRPGEFPTRASQIRSFSINADLPIRSIFPKRERFLISIGFDGERLTDSRDAIAHDGIDWPRRYVECGSASLDEAQAAQLKELVFAYIEKYRSLVTNSYPNVPTDGLYACEVSLSFDGGAFLEGHCHIGRLSGKDEQAKEDKAVLVRECLRVAGLCGSGYERRANRLRRTHLKP